MSIVAYIPAGGEAVRLRPHSLVIPKPIMPIGDKRIIDYSLTIALSIQNIEKVIVSTNQATHIAAPVEEYITQYYSDVEIIRDKKRFRGATGLLDCLNFLEGDGDLFLMCADLIIEDFSFTSFWNFHREKESQVTCLVVPPKNHGEYVICEGGEIKKILSCAETGALSSTGIYLFKKSFLLRYLQKVKKYRSEITISIYRDIIIPAVLDQSVNTVGYFHRGYWDDIGTIERYFYNNMRKSKGKNVFLEPLLQENSQLLKLKRCVYLSRELPKKAYYQAIISGINQEYLTQIQP
ncbi:MAG: sugar phosphate nucleotidyltransferase [Candidatus Taylorbacteria bacterium]|nr:sugar phosphate nucleotidyltransferase [Candidatus Taylorbacteria bacterium]